MAIPSDVIEQVGSEDGVPDPFAGLAFDKSMFLLHNNKPVGTLSQVVVSCPHQADPDDQHQHTHQRNQVGCSMKYANSKVLGAKINSKQSTIAIKAAMAPGICRRRPPRSSV
jgi:hypothetical protein